MSTFLTICSIAIALILGSELGNASALEQSTIQRRMEDSELMKAISGALVYLDDTQVRPRPGKGSPQWDASDEGDGANNAFFFHLPLLSERLGLTSPWIKIRNRTGEWWSDIHVLPKRLGWRGETAFSIQDSNSFVTAFVAYPLFLFSDDLLPPGQRKLRLMKRQATANLARYKRGSAYNFWEVLPGTTTSTPRSGPLNIGLTTPKLLAQAYINPGLRPFWDAFLIGLQMPPRSWLERILSRENPAQIDSLFNVPNDTDCTAVVLAQQRLFQTEYRAAADDAYFSDPKNFRVDSSAIDEIVAYRDLNRRREDGRDSWKGKDTGAYLTWLRSEDEPTFSHGERGVIPFAVNHVDAVVVANALFALALNDQQHAPGFGDSVNTVKAAIAKKAWPEAGLYYPQEMIFPYAASRAFRDGAVLELRESMKILLRDVLVTQRRYVQHPLRRTRLLANPRWAGAFPGGYDPSDHLSTALGLTTLLNIGRDVAHEAGLLGPFEEAVEKAVAYLLHEKQLYAVKHKTTFPNAENHPAQPAHSFTWSGGLFFSDTYKFMNWRSEPYTVAMVLEGLTKYLLAYEEGGVSILQGRKVYIETISADAAREPMTVLIDESN